MGRCCRLESDRQWADDFLGEMFKSVVVRHKLGEKKSCALSPRKVLARQLWAEV